MLRVVKKNCSFFGSGAFFVNEEIKINYKAKNKPFIDILLYICAQLNLKLKVKRFNGYIEKEIISLQTYDVGNLMADIFTEFATSTNSGFGDNNKIKSSKSLYTVKTQFFETLLSNLSILLENKKLSINADAGVLTVYGTQRIIIMF